MKQSFIIAIFFLFCVFAQNVFALETKETLDKKITETSSQIEAINREIAKYENEIAKTSKDKSTLQNLIKELNLTKAKLLKESQKTQKSILLTNNAIDTLEVGIEEKNIKIENAKKALAFSLYSIYKISGRTVVEEMLDIQNIKELSTEYNSRLSINKELMQYAAEVRLAKEELHKIKISKEAEEKKLQSLKEDINLKKKAVENTALEKDKLLKETKNKESNYQKLLAQEKKKREAFEKEMRDYESQLKFILNQKLLPGSGVLSWPLEKIFITQLFGRTSASGRLYASGSHSGVDLRATIGTKVMAMGTGVVEGVGDTDSFCPGASFGKWVFIRYDNGLASTFGHLSYISAVPGQKVVKGDIVGLSGNTGHSTGPHLHVTVYAGQGAKVETLPSKTCNGKTFTMPIAPTSAYLDPMIYLPSTATNMYKADSHRD